MRKVPMHKLIELAHGLRCKEKVRELARRLGIARNTVKGYRDRLEERGLLDPAAPMPDAAVLATLVTPPDPNKFQASMVEPYRETVKDLIEKRCQYTTIWQRLRERGFAGGYSAVKRYCGRHFPKPVEVFCRMESKPGERANIDFGWAGMVRDPKSGRVRKAWFFLMTLAWSRHMYLRFVFDQRIPTFLACIESAFRRFGGVPGELVTDNLKSGVLLADLADPVLGESYRRLARHYGFKAAPIRARTPRHNGKAESGVNYVKESFLAGRDPADIDALNRQGDEWVMTIAGPRIHGTTKAVPLERFERTERAALLPLPKTRFEIPVTYKPKVASDGRVTVDNRRYTVPPEYVGKTLEAYDNGRVVEIYHDFIPVTMHERAVNPGEERSRPEHIPEHKREVVEMTPGRCRDEAAKVGVSCRAAIDRMLDDPEQNRLSAARCLLRLGRTHGAARLEEACRRLLLVDDVNYRRAKTMLRNGADLVPFAADPPAVVSVGRTYRYARPASSFFDGAVTRS